jgi:hypothetical protein
VKEFSLDCEFHLDGGNLGGPATGGQLMEILLFSFSFSLKKNHLFIYYYYYFFENKVNLSINQN